MKKYFTINIILLVLLSQLFVYSLAHAAETVIKLSFASFVPPGHKVNKIHEDWCKEIEKRTNGRVKVTNYPAESLLQAAWTYDGVLKGIADIGLVNAGSTRGQFPLIEVLDLPLGSPSGSLTTKLMNAFVEKFKPKELTEVQFLYASSPGPCLIHTAKKPVNKLEDLKGLKIRCAGTFGKIITALGGTPVSMPPPEQYDALQKGVIDGCWTTKESLINYRIAEVTKYTTDNYGASTGAMNFYCMNKKKWDPLPDDLQKIIVQVNQEFIEIQSKFWNGIDKEGEEFALKKGHTFIPVSKEETARWTEKMNLVYDEFINNMKAKGLPGAEALQYCRDYIQKNL